MCDEDELSRIREARSTWREERLEPTLEDHGERYERFATVSNLEVDRLYGPDGVGDLDYLEDLGLPGGATSTRSASSPARKSSSASTRTLSRRTPAGTSSTPTRRGRKSASSSAWSG